MKREDVFNDIFTNPVSGEEYNIFSDNGFGKRLDWEVGKSEDGKKTVRPINVSFREIDLSKLDSADLPEGVSPSEQRERLTLRILVIMVMNGINLTFMY